jgi:hypothetical protein
MQQHAQMLIARPIDWPGIGSGLGIPRLAYSLANDFAMFITTKKFQIKLNTGISKSQTIPGSIALEAGAHLFRVFCSVSM